jgi:hypothetical protein
MGAIAERHPGECALQVIHRFARMGTIDLRIDLLRQGLGRHFAATGPTSHLCSKVPATNLHPGLWRCSDREGAGHPCG